MSLKVLNDFLHRCIASYMDTLSVSLFLKPLSALSPGLILHFCALGGFGQIRSKIPTAPTITKLFASYGSAW